MKYKIEGSIQVTFSISKTLESENAEEAHNIILNEIKNCFDNADKIDNVEVHVTEIT